VLGVMFALLRWGDGRGAPPVEFSRSVVAGVLVGLLFIPVGLPVTALLIKVFPGYWNSKPQQADGKAQR
jgi:hypothetical protein